MKMLLWVRQGGYRRLERRKAKIGTLGLASEQGESNGNTVITALISTSGAVIVGLKGMCLSTNQLGNRIGDLTKPFERIEDGLQKFKEMVNGKLSALDLELALLMEKS